MTAPPVSSLVCAACSEAVFSYAPFQLALEGYGQDSPKGLTYRTQSWQEIVNAADDNDCNLCGILKDKILEFNGLARNGKRGPPGPQETFQVTLRFLKGPELGVKVDIIDIEHTYPVYCAPDDPAASIIDGRNTVWRVGSDEAFQLALECIAECDRHHPTCPKLEPMELPTRVVDCTDPENPKLFVTVPGGDRSAYAALSYVWGEPQPHSTTTSNIDMYQKGIDIHRLPKTIKDAILCTHKLKLKYLWTDTLCIVQDSPDDKTREISRMHSIYRDAHVTILAASAHKVSVGFLEDRLDPTQDDRRWPFWCPDGRLGTVWVFDDWEYTPYREPVDERAWCFQERALSPRILIYATDSLRYQCATHLINVGGASIRRPSSHWVAKLPDIMASRVPPSVLSDEDSRALEKAWVDALSTYTRRKITDRSDKLPAVSAIAQTFGMWWGTERYIAGLWERRLSHDLLWYRHSPGERTSGDYVAPSWSWAATDGPLAGTMPIDKPLWTIGSCHAVPAAEGFPFGKIKGGRLEVRAVVRKVVWDREEIELFEYRQPKGQSMDPGDESMLGAQATSKRVSGTEILEGGVSAKEPSNAISHDTLTPDPCARLTSDNGTAYVKTESFVARAVTKLIKLIPCVSNKGQPSSKLPAMVDDAGKQVLPRPVQKSTRVSQLDSASAKGTPRASVQEAYLDTDPDQSFSDLPLPARNGEEGTTTKELLGRSGYTHIGWVYLDSEGDQASVVEKGYAVVIGAKGKSILRGLLVVLATKADNGKRDFRRVGVFYLVDGKPGADPEAASGDLASWMSAPAEDISII
ncbi:hypothetical protein PAXINDRAFT_181585 [Paxillus involutus ATCC 200175]|uniref:Heterokaryon incompatibility domain-containing protein n=1 Tax=Paxillus involutus ATCC 200175 TaxID=664439 RepID=A0A0C9TA19_PAXIN|nr:hypothetical protein PAXINDRAFT_181585 [Paxillus involutus ATCC 200175]